MDQFEESLKRRIALAKQQGWSDDEINRSALIERGIQRQRQIQEQQPQQQGAGRATGLKGFAADIVPFGRIAEKIINPNAGKISAGEVLTEGGLTLLPFGLGRVGKAAKAVRAVKGAATAAEGTAAQATPGIVRSTINAAMNPTGGKIAQKTADALRRPGTVANSSTLKTASEQQKVLDLTRQMPSMRGSATRKFRNVEGEIGKLSSNVDDLFKGVNASTPVKTFQSSINSVKKDIVDPLERKRFNIEYENATRKAFGEKLPENITPTDVNKLRRAVNSQMSGIYKKVEAGTTLTDKDTAFLRLKETLDGQLTNLAPEGIRAQVKQLNQNMNTLMRATPEFKKASEQTLQPFGLNIPYASQAIPRIIQAGGDYGGRTITNPLARSSAIQGGLQFATRNQGQGTAPQQPGPAALPFGQPQNADEAILNEALGSGLTDFNSLAQVLSGSGAPLQGQDALAIPQGGLQHDSTELFNSAMEALLRGDNAAYKQLSNAADQALDLEKAMAKGGSKAGGGQNITKVTAQQYGLAQSGAQSLQQLATLMQQDPNIVNRTATPGRGLPTVGGFISNAAGTGSYDAIGYNIADTILRLRTGATANESEVKKLQQQIMPRAGDSQQTKQTKLQQINTIFSNVLDLANQQPTGGSIDELAGLFAGQPQYGY